MPIASAKLETYPVSFHLHFLHSGLLPLLGMASLHLSQPFKAYCWQKLPLPNTFLDPPPAPVAQWDVIPPFLNRVGLSDKGLLLHPPWVIISFKLVVSVPRPVHELLRDKDIVGFFFQICIPYMLIHCKDSVNICWIKLKMQKPTRDWTNRSAGERKPFPSPLSPHRFQSQLGPKSVTFVYRFHFRHFLMAKQRPNPFSKFETCFHC